MLTMTLAAAEIKKLAYSNAEENNFLWSDGATTWTLCNLADELTDEALEGMGEDNTITLTAISLSEDGEMEFEKGFISAAPDWYSDDAGNPVDGNAPCPWCAPWCAGGDNSLWFVPEHMTAYEMGEAYFFCVKDEMCAENGFADNL